MIVYTVGNTLRFPIRKRSPIETKNNVQINEMKPSFVCTSKLFALNNCIAKKEITIKDKIVTIVLS